MKLSSSLKKLTGLSVWAISAGALVLSFNLLIQPAFGGESGGTWDPSDGCGNSSGGSGGGTSGSSGSGGSAGGGGGSLAGGGCRPCGGGGVGGGGSTGGSGQSCESCEGGMPTWEVSEPYINLWIYDEPLGYQPGLGGKISFKLSYKQREARFLYDGVSGNYTGVGPAWNCSWVSYLYRNYVITSNIVDYVCDPPDYTNCYNVYSYET